MISRLVKVFVLVGGLTASVAQHGFAAGLILNEANAVGPRKWINNPDSVGCECAGGSACSTEEDVYFGRIVGNGGDWIEFVVTQDHLDIRGWQLRWAETDATAGNADQANGTDIWFGNGNIEQGTITFTNDALWSDLRAGTIITIIENTTAQAGLDTDLSFDPCSGDWWINVNSSSTQYLTCVNNIDAPSTGCAGPVPTGQFNVGNDSWEIRIVDARNNIVLGPIGEAYAGGPGWQGSGVNSREAIRLSENPSASINELSLYEDVNQSSFGYANRWSDTISPTLQCPRFQDYRALRSWTSCPCAKVALNEYNAVGETLFLNGGTAGADQNGGQAADGFFGRVVGNGGDWFELLVTDDHVDMRGWTLAWEEVQDNQNGTITLSNDPAWSNLRAGTIITFIRSNTAAGGKDTDLTYTPWTGDRWINIWTKDAALIAATTSTVGSHGFGDFHASNDGWKLTILNALSQPVSISSGEGSAGYVGRGVGNTEVCNLQQDASSTTRSWDLYNESILSTFGSLNQWKSCPGNVLSTQDPAVLQAATCTNAADITANGVVNIDDLLAVINSWGSCTGLPCAGDVTNNGVVNIDDLLAVINNWG